KKYVYGLCVENGKIDIIKGVLSLTAVENTGASFGIFANHTTALTVVSIICSVFLFLFIFYSYKYKNKVLRTALVLILAGAIGNIIDRLALGYVRDFIYFELINFAVFNFADSCLTIGAILLIIYVIFFYSKDEKEIKEKEAYKPETIYGVQSTAKPLFVRKDKNAKDETTFVNTEETNDEKKEEVKSIEGAQEESLKEELLSDNSTVDEYVEQNSYEDNLDEQTDNNDIIDDSNGDI
nr:signal peptidase II [Clostridia bacterium]